MPKSRGRKGQRPPRRTGPPASWQATVLRAARSLLAPDTPEVADLPRARQLGGLRRGDERPNERADEVPVLGEGTFGDHHETCVTSAGALPLLVQSGEVTDVARNENPCFLARVLHEGLVRQGTELGVLDDREHLAVVCS